MTQIYHMPGTRSIRAIWAAEELALPYEAIIKQRAELKLPDFIAVNPLGTAPVIRDGDVVFHESCAIVQYLADRYDTANGFSPALTDPARGPYLQWMHFPEATLWPMIDAFIASTGIRTGTPPNEQAMAAAKAKIMNIWNHFDNILSDHPYILGDKFTFADIAVYFGMLTATMLNAVDSSETKHVQAYAGRMKARPAFQKASALPEGWTNQPPGSVATPPILRRGA